MRRNRGAPSRRLQVICQQSGEPSVTWQSTRDPAVPVPHSLSISLRFASFLLHLAHSFWPWCDDGQMLPPRPNFRNLPATHSTPPALRLESSPFVRSGLLGAFVPPCHGRCVCRSASPFAASSDRRPCLRWSLVAAPRIPQRPLFTGFLPCVRCDCGAPHHPPPTGKGEPPQPQMPPPPSAPLCSIPRPPWLLLASDCLPGGFPKQRRSRIASIASRCGE